MQTNCIDDYRHWPLEVLADHIQATQGKLCAETLPGLLLKYYDVCELHRKSYPEIKGVYGLFTEFCSRFQKETEAETHLVFPYVIELSCCHRQNEPIAPPSFSTLSNIVVAAETRFTELTDLLKSAIEMTDVFSSFTQVDIAGFNLLPELNAVNKDLEHLGHVKFKVLYQKAMEMENTVSRSNKQYLFEKIS